MSIDAQIAQFKLAAEFLVRGMRLNSTTSTDPWKPDRKYGFPRKYDKDLLRECRCLAYNTAKFLPLAAEEILSECEQAISNYDSIDEKFCGPREPLLDHVLDWIAIRVREHENTTYRGK